MSAPLAVINEWAAQHWWPKESAVGHTFSIDYLRSPCRHHGDRCRS